MMLEFLETGKALYVLAAVCGLGLLSRLVARNLYKRLMKETDNMTLTKNHYLRDLKQKTENTYRLNQGIHNSRVYLEKQLTNYRFLGVSLSGWGSLGGQMTILCFLLGGAASFGAYWYRCDSYYIVLYSSVGILTGLGTMVADYWANLGERKQQLLNALQDYMENSLFNRLVRETAAASDDGRRDGGKGTGGFGNRDSARALDRRGRDGAVRVSARQSQDGEDQEDQDFKGQDLASLSQGEYAKKGGQAQPAERPGKNGGRAERGEESAMRSQRRAGRVGKKGVDMADDKPEEKSRRDVDYLKNSLEQIAASRERSQADGEWIKDLSPDELELVGQILKQYLV